MQIPYAYSVRHWLTGKFIIGVDEISREEIELVKSSNTASELPLVN